MTNEEKAIIYDQLIRESDFLQRKISKLKSEYAGNMPDDVEKTIQECNSRIALLVNRLENLFKA